MPTKKRESPISGKGSETRGDPDNKWEDNAKGGTHRRAYRDAHGQYDDDRQTYRRSGAYSIRHRPKKDGAVVILRNKAENPEDTEFYLEIKEKSYFVKEYAGKSSLVGGTAEERDESPLETMLREAGEEFVEPKAKEIISKYAKEYGYARIRRKKGDEQFYVHFYEAIIEDPAEWKKIRRSKLKGDGGGTKVVKAKDIGREEFIFGYERVIENTSAIRLA